MQKNVRLQMKCLPTTSMKKMHKVNQNTKIDSDFF